MNFAALNAKWSNIGVAHSFFRLNAAILSMYIFNGLVLVAKSC